MALQTIEVPIKGMDCTECAQHVQRALDKLPGVESAEVYLSSETAVMRLDPSRVDLESIRGAVRDAGYSVPIAARQIENQQATKIIPESSSRIFGTS